MPDAGDVIVEHGIHLTGGFSHDAIAFAGMARVEPGSKDQQGEWSQGTTCEDWRTGEKKDGHNNDLKQRDESLLNAINEHPFHLWNILGNPGHDIAGAALIKPAQTESLQLVVKRRPQIVDSLLLKGVIDENAQAIEEIAQKERADDNNDE